VDLCAGGYADTEYRCYPFVGTPSVVPGVAGVPANSELILYANITLINIGTLMTKCSYSSFNTSMIICPILISQLCAGIGYLYSTGAVMACTTAMLCPYNITAVDTYNVCKCANQRAGYSLKSQCGETVN
jgi:hypothetical protein